MFEQFHGDYIKHHQESMVDDIFLNSWSAPGDVTRCPETCPETLFEVL